MTVQLLISTMNQMDYSLVEKMNIFTDTIVINQCDRTGFHLFSFHGHQVYWYDCQERGIGISRNKALMASKADICIFADDDMVYQSGILDVIENIFERNADASVLVFNLYIKGQPLQIEKFHRLHQWNAFKYGTTQLAIRREDILRKRIFFSLLFGGGARYSCGEDTLFLLDCLKRRLKIVAVPEILGENIPGESTWFKGYNKKFFADKGALYYSMSPFWSRMYCIRYIVLKSKFFYEKISRKEALKWMLEGLKQ